MSLHRKHSYDRFNWLTVLTFVFLAVYAISLFIPFFWTLMTAIKNPQEYSLLDNHLWWPKQVDFSNFATAYKNFYVSVTNSDGSVSKFYMPQLFLNSFLYSLGCAAASTLVPCCVSYACARFKFPFSKVIVAIVIITMSLPIVGSLPSEIQVTKALGLYNHFFGLFILKANFLGLYFLVFYAEFQGIPYAYTEAGKIDGLNNWQIMTRIIFPMAKSTILTVFILNFITYWNDYQIPMIYLPSYPVAAFGMYDFQNSLIQEIAYTPTKLAGILLMTAPILLVFAIFHKKLMINTSIGGIKG